MNIAIGYRKDGVADNILKLAAEHAKAFNGKVFIVSSLKGGEGEKIGELDKAESAMKYAKDFFATKGIPCEEKLLVRGLTPGEDLVQFAEENNIDEIIVGVVKVSKVGKLLMGSTAQYVILHAPCPVISVK
jgi:nucleotide-binding universal stress UspA family protein